MTDQKNTILALILSALVLFGWQYFVGLPQMEKQKQIAQQQALERLQPVPRVAIETPSVQGTIALKGGRIDDLSLTRYHETVDPYSPPIVLLSPSGSPEPYYAEFGWVLGQTPKAGSETEWRQE